MKTTLRDVLNIVFRFIRPLTVFTIAVLIVAGIYGIGAKKEYKSNSKVLVRLGVEQANTTQFIGSASNVYVTRREQELKNELEILTSDGVLNEVARQIVSASELRPKATGVQKYIEIGVNWVKNLIGLAPDDAELTDEIKEYIRDNFEAEALFESDTLELSMTFPDPEVAKKILTIIVDVFIKQHIKAYNTTKEFNFLENELEASRKNYEDLLRQLTDFTNKYGVFDDENQLFLTMEKLRDAQQNLTVIKSDYDYHSKKLARQVALKETIAPVETFSRVEVLNQSRMNLKEKLSEARIEKQILLTRYKDDNRFVKDLEDEIKMIETLLYKEPQRIVDSTDMRKNPIYETLSTNIVDLESEVAGEAAKIESIQADINAINKELRDYATNNQHYQLLSKQVEFAKRTYEKVFEGYLDTRLKNMIGKEEITNISIIEEPSFSLSAYSPKLKRLGLITIAVVVAGNLFLLIFLSFIDTTITNPSELERMFDYPVAGIIPMAKSSKDGGDAASWLYKGNMRSFQSMFANIFLKKGDCRVVAITKSRRGEGGGAMSYNLAVFMANFQEKKIALVDYENGASFSREFSTAERVDENFEKIEINGISIFYFSPSSPEQTQKIKDNYKIIETLKEQFDYIIVTIPPVGDSPELIYLNRYVDKVVLVVEAEKTGAPILRYNVSLLNEYSFENLAMVLNKRRFHIPEYLYRFL